MRWIDRFFNYPSDASQLSEMLAINHRLPLHTPETVKLCYVAILFSRTMGMSSFTLAVVEEISLEIREQLNSHVIKH